jgi:hypothetical protein
VTTGAEVTDRKADGAPYPLDNRTPELALTERCAATARNLLANANIQQLKLTKGPALGLSAQENIEQRRSAATGAEDVDKWQFGAVIVTPMVISSLDHRRLRPLGLQAKISKISDEFVIVTAFP